MSSGRLLAALIDTDILRAFRRGEPDALAFLSDSAQLGKYQISELSATILLADAPDVAERTGLGLFFSWCNIHRITANISKRAFRILARLTPPCGLTADDAIVASTAIEQSLPLYTLDVTRFAAVPKLTVLQPY